MTDAVLVAAISGATTIITAALSVVGTLLVRRLNGVTQEVKGVKANVDGHLTRLEQESIALKGEIGRLAPVGASATPEPGSGAPVMRDTETGTITTQGTPPPPPPERPR